MIELPVIARGADPEAHAGPRLWRSLSQLRKHPHAEEALGHEFSPEAAAPPSGASRRQFLQLMGASMALAGLTACRRPEEVILPYTRQPEEIIPGIPLYYATAMPFRGVLRSVLVESHDGRPTKVEGNPEHPASRGRTSIFEQASVLDLYDPDRSAKVWREGAESSMPAFAAFCKQLVAGAAQRRVAVLAPESSSMTLAELRAQMAARYPGLRWITYTPEGDDLEALGAQLAFGRPLRPYYRFSEAAVIVSFDADFLGPQERNFLGNTAEFAASRRILTPEDRMSRLYVAESAFSPTGAKADHRLRIRSVDAPAVLAAVAARLGVAGAPASPFADDPWVAAAAADLQAAGAAGLVLAGETQPAEVHALCAAVNSRLGAAGRTVVHLDTGEAARPPQGPALAQLVADLRAGAVDTLVMLGVNPVYDMPGELGFAEALKQTPYTIHAGLYFDETAAASRWHVPLAHYLEAWGDGRTYDGSATMQQPLIAPLYADALSELELVHLLAAGTPRSGYDLVRARWQALGLAAGEDAWRAVLHNGFAPNTAYPVAAAGAGAAALRLPTVEPDAVEVVFRLDSKVLDGCYANNAWLQELPESMTKIVWDNAAVMSPATAKRLGVEVDYEEGMSMADRIEITLGGRTLDAPVWVQPGHADNSITLRFGYGRNIRSLRDETPFLLWDTDRKVNVYAQGALGSEVGVNVYPLRSAALERIAVGPAITRAGGGYLLATTQEHGSMEGRPIVRAATLEEYRKNPAFVKDAVEPLPGGGPWDEYPALWQENHPKSDPYFKDNLYYPNQWGMVIDLNTCTGCNACVVACQAENNVPVVGKQQVAHGREMHWLRVDRYYMSEDEEHTDTADVAFQPMFCVHCENAPCEPVCPVYATSHSPDGISEMTYNRCIGTRYCSNNCPYKVRKFNYFHWMKDIPPTVQMQMNPDVTVRFRGVMEKCTYCVQRVREAQREAAVQNRNVRDGDVQTACQQVCPANAIVFGDINNPNAPVSVLKRQPNRYEVLEEINTKPRTSYMGLVRNPNPALAPAAPAAATQTESHDVHG